MIVHNKQARAISFDGLTGLLVLKPGINEILDADFNFAKGAFESAGLIKAGLIVVGPSKEEKKGSEVVTVGKSLKDITEISVVEEMVNATFDNALLDKWRKEEKREDVRILIINQIDLLKTPRKPEGESA